MHEVMLIFIREGEERRRRYIYIYISIYICMYIYIEGNANPLKIQNASCHMILNKMAWVFAMTMQGFRNLGGHYKTVL